MTSPLSRWRLLWLAVMAAPAAANAALDTPGFTSFVVLAGAGLATVAWGFTLERRGRASLATLRRCTWVGGSVLAASWVLRAALEGSPRLWFGLDVLGVALCLAVVGTLLAAGMACARIRRVARIPTPVEILSGLAGLALCVVALAIAGLGAAVSVGPLTQSSAWTAIAAIVGLGLLAVLPGLKLWDSRRSAPHALGAGLTGGAAVAMVGLLSLAVWTHFGPYGPSEQELGTQLEGSVAGDRPVFYLGQKAAGMRVAGLYEDGQHLSFEYGRCMEGGDVGVTGADGSCTSPVEVTSEPAATWVQPEDGCIRLQPVRGVPAVVANHALTLFTGPSAVTILVWTANAQGYIGDPAKAQPLARWVRAWGDAAAPAQLPPPPPGTVDAVNERCANHPR